MAEKKPNKKIRTLESRQRRFGYIFVIPFLIGLLVFIIIPLVQTIVFSFSSLKITADGYSLEEAGLSNYNYIFFVDNNFRQDLLESLGDMLINVPICSLFAFFMASLLNTNFHGRTAARIILFLPVITSASIIAKLQAGDVLQTLQSVTESTKGTGLSDGIVQLMNQMSLNTELVSFIASTVERLSEIVSMSAVPIVIFLAGLQSISPSAFEAAYIEGATKWDVFWKISLPMVSPLILVCIIYCIIDSFTDVANPVIDMIHTTNFERINFGVGSAMAISYMIIMGLFLALVYKIVSKFIVYQES